MVSATLAEQIAAVRECIASERKALALLRLPGVMAAPTDRAECETRIGRLEVAARTLERLRAAGSVPPKGAAA